MLRVLFVIPLLYGGYFCAHKLYKCIQFCARDQAHETGSDVIARIKKQLQLEPHPSGAGAFKQVWKGDRQVSFYDKTSHSGPRSTGTSIYLLRVAPVCVKWHKHLSDQAFFWHAGGALNIHMISQDGTYTCEVLCDVTTNEKCSGHVVIAHDTLYAVELEKDAIYNLCSEVVMPASLKASVVTGPKGEIGLPGYDELPCIPMRGFTCPGYNSPPMLHLLQGTKNCTRYL